MSALKQGVAMFSNQTWKEKIRAFYVEPPKVTIPLPKIDKPFRSKRETDAPTW